ARAITGVTDNGRRRVFLENVVEVGPDARAPVQLFVQAQVDAAIAQEGRLREKNMIEDSRRRYIDPVVFIDAARLSGISLEIQDFNERLLGAIVIERREEFMAGLGAQVVV